MNTRHIRSEAEYSAALARIDALWDAASGSAEAAELDALATAVSVYEANARADVLPPARPGPLIAYKLRELGWSQRELGRRLGWAPGRVSEVVSGKRRLTLAMVRDLAALLEIDARLLVHDPAPGIDEVWVRVDASLAAQASSRAYRGHASLDALVDALLAEAVLPSVTSFRAPSAKRVASSQRVLSFNLEKEAA